MMQCIEHASLPPWSTNLPNRPKRCKGTWAKCERKIISECLKSSNPTQSCTRWRLKEINIAQPPRFYRFGLGGNVVGDVVGGLGEVRAVIGLRLKTSSMSLFGPTYSMFIFKWAVIGSGIFSWTTFFARYLRLIQSSTRVINPVAIMTLGDS